MSRLLCCVVWCVSILTVNAAAAQSIPTFTGERLYLVSVPEPGTYLPLADEIAAVEKNAPERYYVVVANDLGSKEAAREYLDRVLSTWLIQAQRDNLTFAPGRAVLVVVDLKNQQIAMRVGSELQDRHKLRDDAVKENLTNPLFVPHAREGDVKGGLKALIEGTDRWIAQREGRNVAGSKAAAPVGSKDSPTNKGGASTATPPGGPVTTLPGTQSWLPWLLGLPLAAGIIGAYAYHRLTRRKAARELQAYKDQVMAVSDRLDALKERHKMLTYLDEDYKTPMEGETRSLYDQAGSAIERFRVRWLKLMDAWGKADELVKSEAAFRTKKLKEARRILSEAGAPTELSSIEKECAEPLDRLEAAHQQVDAALQEAVGQREGVLGQLRQLQEVNLPTGPYQYELNAAGELVEKTRAQRNSDPIDAESLIAAAREKLRALAEWTAEIMKHFRGAGEAEGRLTDADGFAKAKRAEGFVLQEREGNPEPHLDAGRTALARARKSLDLAEAVPAGEDVRLAVEAADLARQVVQRHVEAKAYCAEQRPARLAQSRAIADRYHQAAQVQADLRREFAENSWKGVADNLHETQQLMTGTEQALTAADEDCDPHRQHYMRARAALEAAARMSDHADQLLDALSHRLTELRALRGKCEAELGKCQSDARRVDHLLRTHTEDRPRAALRLRSAVALLDQLLADSRLVPADWVRISSRLGEVQADLARAEQYAREDIQLAQQAASEILETERALRSARGATHFGFGADLSAAQLQLQQAQARLSSQDYEESIALANAAEHAARAALHAAAEQARWHQLEQERLRRARQATTMGAPTVIVTPGQGLEWTAVGPATVPSSSRGTGTSQTSWSTGTSQTGW